MDLLDSTVKLVSVKKYMVIQSLQSYLVAVVRSIFHLKWNAVKELNVETLDEYFCDQDVF